MTAQAVAQVDLVINARGLQQTNKQLGDFNKNAKAANDSVGDIGKNMLNLGSIAKTALKGITGLAAGLTAAAIGITAFAVAQAEMARETIRNARAANSSTRDFNRYAAAVATVGIDADKAADQLKDMRERIGEFKVAGTGTFQDLADALKLDADEALNLANELSNLSGQDALGRVATLLQDAGVSGTEMSYAVEGLASDLTYLIPLLANNSAGIKELGEEWDKSAGKLQITDQQRQSLIDFERAIKGFKTGLRLAGVSIVSQFLPKIKDLFGTIIVGLVEATDRFAKFLDFWGFFESPRTLKELTADLDAARKAQKALNEEIYYADGPRDEADPRTTTRSDDRIRFQKRIDLIKKEIKQRELLNAITAGFSSSSTKPEKDGDGGKTLVQEDPRTALDKELKSIQASLSTAEELITRSHENRIKIIREAGEAGAIEGQELRQAYIDAENAHSIKISLLHVRRNEEHDAYLKELERIETEAEIAREERRAAVNNPSNTAAEAAVAAAVEQQARITAAVTAGEISRREEITAQARNSLNVVRSTTDEFVKLESSKNKKLATIGRIAVGVQKGIAITQAGIAIGAATAQALNATFPASLIQAAIVAAEGAKILSIITGQAHDGLTNVPREGTFLLDKGERVVSAEQNKDLSNFMKGGSGGGATVNNNITITQKDGESQEALSQRISQDIVAAMRPVITGQIVEELRPNNLLNSGVRAF